MAKALEAPRVPTPEQGVAVLEFSAALLGQNLSRGTGDSAFRTEPRGNWIGTKVFVAEGGGEFFLNLEPRSGWGEIAIKDPDYSTTVMRELAPVLMGAASTGSQPVRLFAGDKEEKRRAEKQRRAEERL